MGGQLAWPWRWMAYLAIECQGQLNVPPMRTKAQRKMGAERGV